MAVSKTRFTATDAAEAKCNLAEVAQEDRKRERAPTEGLKVSDNPIKPVDLEKKRGRAPAEGAKDSDIPTQFLDSARGGGTKDALGSGKGKREQAPSQERRTRMVAPRLWMRMRWTPLRHWLGNASGHPWGG